MWLRMLQWLHARRGTEADRLFAASFREIVGAGGPEFLTRLTSADALLTWPAPSSAPAGAVLYEAQSHRRASAIALLRARNAASSPLAFDDSCDGLRRVVAGRGSWTLYRPRWVTGASAWLDHVEIARPTAGIAQGGRPGWR